MSTIQAIRLASRENSEDKRFAKIEFFTVLKAE